MWLPFLRNSNEASVAGAQGSEIRELSSPLEVMLRRQAFILNSLGSQWRIGAE